MGNPIKVFFGVDLGYLNLQDSLCYVFEGNKLFRNLWLLSPLGFKTGLTFLEENSWRSYINDVTREFSRYFTNSSSHVKFDKTRIGQIFNPSPKTVIALLQCI